MWWPCLFVKAGEEKNGEKRDKWGEEQIADRARLQSDYCRAGKNDWKRTQSQSSPSPLVLRPTTRAACALLFHPLYSKLNFKVVFGLDITERYPATASPPRSAILRLFKYIQCPNPLILEPFIFYKKSVQCRSYLQSRHRLSGRLNHRLNLYQIR